MLPNAKGFYGDFGGSFVSPEISAVLDEVKQAFLKLKEDKAFNDEFAYYLKDYVGRPSPLYYAGRLTEKLGGAKIYLKREDLNHTGSHKINNTIGQVLLAKHMGKTRIIAETGAGQHGVATATACALFNLDCVVYMGEEDIRRQELNVFKMEMLGAKVVSVTTGTKTLSDAVDAAFADLVTSSSDTYYMLGSAVGPDPYPQMVKYFQSVISAEMKEQFAAINGEGTLPDYVVACIGGGSNAIGAFANFYDNKEVALIGIEAAGLGLDTPDHAASISKGTQGLIHGFKTYVLQDEKGEILPVYSVSAGLDYPGVGPEHSYYHATGRAVYKPITDKEAIDAFLELSKVEGVIPAIESAHAVAYVLKLAPTLPKEKSIIINLSGRGDKDVQEISDILKRQS